MKKTTASKIRTEVIARLWYNFANRAWHLKFIRRCYGQLGPLLNKIKKQGRTGIILDDLEED